MASKKTAYFTLVFAIILTFLFYKQSFGINLLIGEIIFFIWLMYKGTFQRVGVYTFTLAAGLLMTGFFSVINHSSYTIFINLVVLFIFSGLLIFPQTKSLIYAAGQSFHKLLNGPVMFLNDLSGNKRTNSSRFWRKFSIFALPVIIILFFVLIYRLANPIFDNALLEISDFVEDTFGKIFEYVDFLVIPVFLVCLFVSIFLLNGTPNQYLIELDKKATLFLIRQRKPFLHTFRMTALKNELKSGVFLFLALNILLLILNIIDIRWVWFGFEWEGEYLKQFVHEGTYLLILSILISIALVIYFFRGNQNFYSQNRLLKYLSYAWIFQNAILAVSVAIRNFWYIHYFALAYKRIGVIIFLLLTLYGLYTVFLKVKHRKTSFYLFKQNSFAIILVLMISSLIHWDQLIAKYNFAHADRSFLHLDFMSGLPDKTLPYLDKSLDELKDIQKKQTELFPFEEKYMVPEYYVQYIANRKNDFIDKWENTSLLSWNLAEYRAYKKLKEKNTLEK